MDTLLSRMLFVTLIVGKVTVMGDEECRGRHVNDIMNECRGVLGQMMSYILHATTDDFTLACRQFSLYIECVHPNIRSCELTKENAQFISEYHTDLDLYMGSPFNCTMPPTSHLNRTILPKPKPDSNYAHLPQALPSLSPVQEWKPETDHRGQVTSDVSSRGAIVGVTRGSFYCIVTGLWWLISSLKAAISLRTF